MIDDDNVSSAPATRSRCDDTKICSLSQVRIVGFLGHPSSLHIFSLGTAHLAFPKADFLTCRQFYDIGSAIFYEINYFRVESWTIRRGSGLAPLRVNPYHFIKNIWLEDDFAPQSGKGKDQPSWGFCYTRPARAD